MNAIADLFGAIEAQIGSLGVANGEEVFFRGVSNSKWSLEPSLLRAGRTQSLNPDEMRWIESAQYFEFRARAQELQTKDLSGWDWLFAMRHHGLPSRLLDWTEVLGFALYFALEGWTPKSKDTPRIWILDPYGLNQTNWGVRDLILPEFLTCEWVDDEETAGEYDFDDYLAAYWEFEFDKPVAIYPQQKNRRQHVQRGWFTVHGNKSQPLEELNAAVVRFVDLPPDMAEACQHQLRWFGFDRYLVYPDLDSLSKSLCSKYLETSGKPRAQMARSIAARAKRKVRRKHRKAKPK